MYSVYGGFTMFEFIKGLSTIKQTIIGILLLIVLGAFALNWYTDGKVKDAFVDFGIKQIELIKGDQNAVDKVDDNIGDGSILDGLLGVPTEDTGNGQERGEIYSGEISYTDPEEKDYERIYPDSGSSTSEELFIFGLPEQPKTYNPYPFILQECDEITTSDCDTYPECCEVQ